MPVERELPDIESKGQPITSESVPLRFAEDQLQDWYALQLVKTAFSQYEAFRMNSHDPRWNLNDMLYASYVPQRNWPGSDIPRSSLGLSIVFEQVEGAIPQIAQSLFSNPEWFRALGGGLQKRYLAQVDDPGRGPGIQRRSANACPGRCPVVEVGPKVSVCPGGFHEANRRSGARGPVQSAVDGHGKYLADPQPNRSFGLLFP